MSVFKEGLISTFLNPKHGYPEDIIMVLIQTLENFNCVHKLSRTPHDK